MLCIPRYGYRGKRRQEEERTMATAEPAALRADARANRLRVIEAARAVFRERGLEAEMREIAERAGVGFGTVYRNFPTKDELVAAVAAEMIERMRAAIHA